MAEVIPFRIDMPDAELADLRRLRQTRWPEREPVTDWSQGVPLAYLRELCGYWADGYDWRSSEAWLNALPQFQTVLDGLTVHFIHVRSPRPDALPLIITHGWPGSVVEFIKVIRPRSDPLAHGGEETDAFHVVCPSLPGYGFSGEPDRTGWGFERIAGAWVSLMARLGYRHYGAVGSDWGTSVSALVGRQDPEHIAGIHLIPPLAGPDPATLGDLTEADTVDVPTGCSVFPHELQRPSRRWAEKRFTDIRYWNEPARGGHFAAFEQPELFVEEVRAFFRLVR
jgi:epoxide hydrolase